MSFKKRPEMHQVEFEMIHVPFINTVDLNTKQSSFPSVPLTLADGCLTLFSPLGQKNRKV